MLQRKKKRNHDGNSSRKRQRVLEGAPQIVSFSSSFSFYSADSCASLLTRAPAPALRVVGQLYNFRGKKAIWSGKCWHCEHSRRSRECKECGGSSICQHNRQCRSCKECGGASICEHNRQRSHCKECGGASICEHNRQRSYCKECGGAQSAAATS